MKENNLKNLFLIINNMDYPEVITDQEKWKDYLEKVKEYIIKNSTFPIKWVSEDTQENIEEKLSVKNTSSWVKEMEKEKQSEYSEKLIHPLI